MILIDLGNSRAKLARLDATKDFVSINNARLEASVVHQHIEEFGDEKEVVFASVRGASANQVLINGLEQYGYKSRFIIWQDLKHLLNTEYDSRATLGIDRQLAMLGAIALSQTATIVIDLGTASTIDVLNQDHKHLGGVIFAGLDLQREALLAGTDDINIKDVVNTATTFPMSTTDAVASGTLLAWRAAVLGVRNEMLKKLPVNTQTFIAGGQLKLLGNDLDETISIVPDLVLKGMEYMLLQEQ